MAGFCSVPASENELNGHAYTHTHTHRYGHNVKGALIASKSLDKFMAKVNAVQNFIGQSSTWAKFFDRVTPTFSRVL